MLRHPSGENSQKGMCAWNLGTARECFSCLGVVLQFGVINKSQTVIELPVIGIILDSELCQLDGTLRFSCAIGWARSKEVVTEFVSRKKFRIQLCRQLQQWREQVEVVGTLDVLVSEVLHSACPIEIGHQPGISQTHAPQGIGGSDIQYVLEVLPASQFVERS